MSHVTPENRAAHDREIRRRLQEVKQPETPVPLTDAQRLLHLRMSINPSSFRVRHDFSELAMRLQAGLPLFYDPGHFTGGL